MSKDYLISGIIVAVIAVALFVILSCTYIIDEREQAVVTRFNKPVHVILGDVHGEIEVRSLDERRELVQASVRELAGEGQLDLDETDGASDIQVSQGAGLYFKMPFVDEVHRMPNVILGYDAAPWEMHLADQKLIRVDNFARWYIDNPLLFLVRVRTEANAHDRLRDGINDLMRGQVGGSDLTEVIRTTNRFIDRRPAFLDELGEELGHEVEEMVAEEFYHDSPIRERIERGREKIMAEITETVDDSVREWGVQVLDVRIRKAELLEENLEAVFRRMVAERSRLSKGYRSEGDRQAAIIRGNTDRRKEVILANARRDAEILRGEGDAQATAMFGDAFGAHPEVYEFIRTLDLIQNSTPEGSELILGLDTSIYRLLRSAHISMAPSDILEDRDYVAAQTLEEPVPEAPEPAAELTVDVLDDDLDADFADPEEGGGDNGEDEDNDEDEDE